MTPEEFQKRELANELESLFAGLDSEELYSVHVKVKPTASSGEAFEISCIYLKKEVQSTATAPATATQKTKATNEDKEPIEVDPAKHDDKKLKTKK